MIGAVVLAAGGSTRFGAPKQLAALDGRPLLEHVVRTVGMADGIGRVVVVLGADADAIRALTGLGDAEIVVAEGWEEGIAASLRAGIAALAGAEAALVLLGDQPMVTSEAIAAVLAAGAGVPAARATYDGAPGHPVLIGHQLFDEVAALRGDDGARDLLERRGVVAVECSQLASGHDVDTPADLDAIADNGQQ